jgi:very-short-patch-repair endonuclease
MPKPRGHFVGPAILQRARDFRHPLTPPEAKVWHGARDRQLAFKFRRQHPIGRFIADFYCAEARLAIEIDGDIHGQLSQEEHDRARDAWLAERGHAVIRFPARQVEQDLDGVLRRIMEACEARSG